MNAVKSAADVNPTALLLWTDCLHVMDIDCISGDPYRYDEKKNIQDVIDITYRVQKSVYAGMMPKTGYNQKRKGWAAGYADYPFPYMTEDEFDAAVKKKAMRYAESWYKDRRTQCLLYYGLSRFDPTLRFEAVLTRPDKKDVCYESCSFDWAADIAQGLKWGIEKSGETAKVSLNAVTDPDIPSKYQTTHFRGEISSLWWA